MLLKAKVALLFLILLASMWMLVKANAHDPRYAEKHPLTKEQHTWFDGLKSGKGLCCSDVDGTVLTDNDWESRDGHYRVFIDDKWWDVPDEAVVKEPNMYGPTMVWPFRIWNLNGGQRIEIRCFIPGMMT